MRVRDTGLQLPISKDYTNRGIKSRGLSRWTAPRLRSYGLRGHRSFVFRLQVQRLRDNTDTVKTHGPYRTAYPRSGNGNRLRCLYSSQPDDKEPRYTPKKTCHSLQSLFKTGLRRIERAIAHDKLSPEPWRTKLCQMVRTAWSENSIC